jgi:hypothetical protein
LESPQVRKGSIFPIQRPFINALKEQSPLGYFPDHDDKRKPLKN